MTLTSCHTGHHGLKSQFDLLRRRRVHGHSRVPESNEVSLPVNSVPAAMSLQTCEFYLDARRVEKMFNFILFVRCNTLVVNYLSAILFPFCNV